MTRKIVGFAALTILFVVASAGSAFADRIPVPFAGVDAFNSPRAGDVDATFVAAGVTIDFPTPAIFDHRVVAADFEDHRFEPDLDATASNVLWWSAKTWHFHHRLHEDSDPLGTAGTTDSVASPEPASLFLLGAGLAGLSLIRRKSTRA